LHIGYVEAGYPHPHGGGGAGTYVQLVGRELVRRGHQVSVLTAACQNCPPESWDHGVRVFRPVFKAPLHWYLTKFPLIRDLALSVRTLELDWRIYRFLQGIHSQQPFDLVEFTEGVDFWHAMRPRFATVSHTHGSRFTTLKMVGQPVNRKDWYDRKIGLFGIRKADWVVSPSQAMLSIVEGEAGKPFRHSSVIPYPLDPALTNLSPETSEKPGDKKIVLFAARNDPVKGADVLVQAIPLVAKQVPEVEFWCFGYQPGPTDGEMNNVRFFPFLPKKELFPYYIKADLVVVPSRWDNSPNTIYEAMAAGKPVVASQVGGIPELVVDEETGLLVHPGNPVLLSNAIIKILTNEKRSHEMGHIGQQRIIKIANLESNVDRRLMLYCGL
jgi:glycosyltransferase involved in cell wall biosynthesis